MAENLCVLAKERFKIQNLPKYFYGFLWIQIISGIIIFLLGFTEPLTLVVTGAVLNAITMFIYSGLILWLNLTNLQKELRPNAYRIFFVAFAFVFYGAFSIYTIYNRFFS
jgi:hypothetical protein